MPAILHRLWQVIISLDYDIRKTLGFVDPEANGQRPSFSVDQVKDFQTHLSFPPGLPFVPGNDRSFDSSSYNFFPVSTMTQPHYQSQKQQCADEHGNVFGTILSYGIIDPTICDHRQTQSSEVKGVL
jgi:hypothetical protein